MYTLTESGLEFDVIEIDNRPDKPFYLTRDKKQGEDTIRSGVIYTRLGDTNIPLRESAPEDKIELMWRERFGIRQPPLERLSKLLEVSEDWTSSEEGKMHRRIFSEFNIIDGEILHDPFQEAWVENFLDKRAYSIRVQIYYFGTLIKSMGFVICDGGRYRISIPNLPSLGQSGSLHIIRDSIEYKFTKITNRTFRDQTGDLGM